ncbi:MAG TPA: ABC transporter substrate-binding protein [Acidobacteriota bacterium]|nr:ABC transporter substrate-binding protein [Acidobacteriota bacterium]
MKTPSSTSLSRFTYWLLPACLLVAAGLAAAAASDDLTPQEQRGKQIYLTGASPSSQPVVALMGEEKTEVPATLLPCVNCHGSDGRGRPEGGVIPSNVRWETLTKPYGVRHETGRSHPPYTLETLTASITEGVDPAGNALNTAMPRYRMSDDDLQALVAYLQKLGQERDPGVDEESLRLGLLLPPGSLMVAESMRRLLQAYFEDVNQNGGIYGRKLELQTYYLPADPAQAESAVIEFIDEKDIFALVSPFLADREEALVKLADRRGLPMVGPITLRPQLDFPLNRKVFYLLSGLATQSRVLIGFAAQQSGLSQVRLAVVAPLREDLKEAVDAAKEEAFRQDWPEVVEIRYAAGELKPAQAVKKLRQGQIDAVLFLGRDADASAWLEAAEAAEYRPYLLSPASLAGAALFQAPQAFAGKIFSSAATLPADFERSAVGEFLGLAQEADLSRQGRPQQILTLASAKILLEGLRQSGRDVSREKLVDRLEGLYRFETGLTPPVTYNPNRRIGAKGAYVLLVDLEKKDFTPQGPFREWSE